MADEFHVLLLSNASLERHPENTVASFTNVLRDPITLEGRYEVGMHEFFYVNSMHNVRRGANLIRIRAAPGQDTKDKSLALDLHVPPDLYKNRSQLLTAINLVLRTGGVKGKFSVDLATHLTVYEPFDAVNNTKVHITLSVALCVQLGYNPGTKVNIVKLSQNVLDMSHNAASNFMVYTNIVEEQIVGNSCVPLLRMVNSDYMKHEYGASVSKGFLNVTYVPVVRRAIDRISIDICDTQGEKIAFNGGRSAVLLHFRRRAKQ